MNAHWIKLLEIKVIFQIRKDLSCEVLSWSGRYLAYKQTCCTFAHDSKEGGLKDHHIVMLIGLGPNKHEQHSRLHRQNFTRYKWFPQNKKAAYLQTIILNVFSLCWQCTYVPARWAVVTPWVSSFVCPATSKRELSKARPDYNHRKSPEQVFTSHCVLSSPGGKPNVLHLLFENRICKPIWLIWIKRLH